MTEVKNNIRLADYFFRAGLSPHCDLAKIKCSKKVTLTDVESSRRSLTKPGDPHPLENSYEPDTIFRYPKEDYDEHEKYPPFTPIFCFPNDIGFIAQENGKPIDTFHSFIVTESSGRKLYGVCITTHVPPTKNQSAQLEDMISKWRANNLVESDYEFAQHVQQQLAFEKEKLLKINSGMEDSGGESVALVEEKIGVLEELIKPMKKSILVDTDNVFVPTCLGILSRFPFYDLLKDWLSHLMGSIIEAEFERYPFERCVINLIHEIPLPPPGKLEIGISIHNHILYGSRPPINTIPILKNYSSYPLFKAMSIENIVTLFELLVTDYKVILLSEHVSMLNLTCEVVTGWLYPLFWHHILIPVLPFRLLNYLEAPVPYLIGIQKKAFPEWKQDGWRPTDAAIIDIDNNHIDFPPLTVKIPSKERKKLLTQLERLTGQLINATNGCTTKKIPITMQCAYPFGKIAASTYHSVIGARKIKDIPTSMYNNFNNKFLLEKSTKKSGHKGSVQGSTLGSDSLSPSRAESQRVAEDHAKLSQLLDQHTVSDSIGSFVPTPRESQKKPPPSHLCKETSNLSEVSKEIDIKEALQNAPPTLRLPSVHQDPVSDEAMESEVDLREALKYKQPLARGSSKPTSLNISTTNFSNLPSPLSATATTATTNSTKFSWWKNSATTTTPNTTTLESPKKKQSLFERFLGGAESIESVAASNDMLGSQNVNDSQMLGSQALGSQLLGSQFLGSQVAIQAGSQSGSQKLGSNTHVGSSNLGSGSLMTSVPELSIPEEKALFRDGHWLHKLQLADKEVDIDEEDDDKSEGEYADRFTADSDSSDDMSRSEMSTIGERSSSIFQGSRRPSQRASGQFNRNPYKEYSFARRATDNSSPSRQEKVKVSGRINCNLCYNECLSRTQTIYMCQHCHIQIHEECLKLIESQPCPLFFNSERIDQTFFKIFTSLFKHYRNHLKVGPKKGVDIKNKGDEDSMDTFFGKQEFLAEFDHETKNFMQVVIGTQAFTQFIFDRVDRPESDYDILFFDESIKQKLNRSKMRFSKEPTPFLNETAYQISTLIQTLPPNFDDLPRDSFEDVDPFQWQSAYEIEPREVQPLLTEADDLMMRSHTNEVIHRARTAAARGKQDFTKWMKFKWKKPSEAGMLTDDQKREMLDQRLDQVCKVIDRYEAAHISSQKHVQIDQAICTLHEQNTILLKAADEVVDTTDQEELQRMIMRLIRVITIYEEHKVKSHNRESSSIPQTPSTSFPPPPPLPPRRATTKIIDRNETETRVAEWVVDVAEKGTGKNGEGSPESLHPGVMEDSRLVSSPEIQTAITHTANHEVDKLTKQSLDATLVVSDFRN